MVRSSGYPEGSLGGDVVHEREAVERDALGRVAQRDSLAPATLDPGRPPSGGAPVDASLAPPEPEPPDPAVTFVDPARSGSGAFDPCMPPVPAPFPRAVRSHAPAHSAVDLLH